MTTRLIVIQPWALIVNTTGQLISLHSSTNILCIVPNMSVIAPPTIEVCLYYLMIHFE